MGRTADLPNCGELDTFVTRLLCRDGVTWETPGCGGGRGSSRSLGLQPVSAGFSVATAVVLVLLLAVLVVWYRRWTMLRQLDRAPALEETRDPEQPPRSSLRQSRKQRRIQRLLRLRRQHVHFNEAVDVNEFFGMPATKTSNSDAPAARLGGRGRHGSIFVSGRVQNIINGSDEEEEEDEDDEEDMSGLGSRSGLGTSTEDNKKK